jgi:predicted nuclease with RNAse H fold
MAILLGVRPGGRDGFAVSALYWAGALPSRLILARSFSGVDAVRHAIMGVVGEWGEMTAAAIDAPLTWSGSANGERAADEALRQSVPAWAPRTWFRSPNALPGAVGIQGPALAWSLALEAKRDMLPEHRIFETHARASLARLGRDLSTAVRGYRDKKVPEAARARHRHRIIERLADTGVVQVEAEPPDSAEQVEALICAVTALAYCFPETGVLVHEIEGGEIRPVGKRPVVILSALP